MMPLMATGSPRDVFSVFFTLALKRITINHHIGHRAPWTQHHSSQQQLTHSSLSLVTASNDCTHIHSPAAAPASGSAPQESFAVARRRARTPSTIDRMPPLTQWVGGTRVSLVSSGPYHRACTPARHASLDLPSHRSCGLWRSRRLPFRPSVARRQRYLHRRTSRRRSAVSPLARQSHSCSVCCSCLASRRHSAAIGLGSAAPPLLTQLFHQAVVLLRALVASGLRPPSACSASISTVSPLASAFLRRHAVRDLLKPP